MALDAFGAFYWSCFSSSSILSVSSGSSLVGGCFRSASWAASLVSWSPLSACGPAPLPSSLLRHRPPPRRRRWHEVEALLAGDGDAGGDELVAHAVRRCRVAAAAGSPPPPSELQEEGVKPVKKPMRKQRNKWSDILFHRRCAMAIQKLTKEKTGDVCRPGCVRLSRGSKLQKKPARFVHEKKKQLARCIKKMSDAEKILKVEST